MCWAACLLWGTDLPTFSFTWLKAHILTPGPFHPAETREGHRTLICTARNNLQTVPVCCITKLWQTFFFFHTADCISIFQRAECSCTRTSRQWSTFTGVWLLPSVLLQGYTAHGAPCSAFGSAHKRPRQWNWAQTCSWGLCGEGSHCTGARGLHSQVLLEHKRVLCSLLPSPVNQEWGLGNKSMYWP